MEPAVTVFANDEGRERQKPRQPVGRKSSFPPDALDEITPFWIDSRKKRETFLCLGRHFKTIFVNTKL